MKKVLLLAAMTVAISASANDIDLTFQWHRQVANATVTPYCIQPTQDGGHFVAFNMSSAQKTMQWGATSVDITEQVNASSVNGILIAKADDEGNLVWEINNRFGQVSLSQNNLVATPDGGFVAAFTSCNSSTGRENPNVFEMAGTNDILSEVAYSCPDNVSPYVGIILKVDAQGVIEWIQKVEPDVYGTIGSSLAFRTVTCDTEGNIYVGGYSILGYTVYSADGHTYHFDTVNQVIESDSKASGKDLFVLKYNSEGNYVGRLAVDATASYATEAQIDVLNVVDGALYMAGLVKSSAAFTLGGQQVASTEGLSSFFAAKADLALSSLAWANTATAEANSKGSAVQQIYGLDAYDGNVYVAGAVNGSLSWGDTKITCESTNLNAFAAAFAQNDGILEGAYIRNKEGISVAYHAYADNNTVAFYTYNMQMSGAGDLGVIYQVFDIATGESIDQLMLIDGTNSCFNSYLNRERDTLLIGARTNKDCAIYGTSETTGAKVGTWDGQLVQFKVSGMTGVENVAVAETDANAPVVYYNLQGQRVANPAAGQLLIRQQGNTATKVLY